MVTLWEYSPGDVFLSMLWFFLFFIWIWLLISIFSDIFRSPDLSGWGKALWSLFVIVLPYLGVFCYLIARGKKMAEHAVDEENARDAAFRGYVQDVVATTPAAGAPNGVDQLATLASLKADGVINEEEFQRMKAKVTAAV